MAYLFSHLNYIVNIVTSKQIILIFTLLLAPNIYLIKNINYNLIMCYNISNHFFKLTFRQELMYFQITERSTDPRRQK